MILLAKKIKIYARQNVELSRSVLSGWVDACCRLLSPREQAPQQYVLADGKLHADDGGRLGGRHHDVPEMEETCLLPSVNRH
ncbi:Transposase IS66 family [Budvicia aquatica]|uniref:Transposase IS66 family n=1 Tax=Budvicia aquatica TaxID=82979 RepID=A0A485A0K9_9GAMM|nr:Transposase IS66 family [Budvicia aquatica]